MSNRIRQLVVLTVTFILTTLPFSATAAQDSVRVRILADSLQLVRTAFEQQLNTLSRQIALVDSNLTTQSASTNTQQEQALKSLGARIQLIERAGTERYLARVSELQLRYDAGTEVLDGTIQQLNNLDFAVSFAQAVGSLNALGNPQGYAGFQRRYTQVASELRWEGNEGLRNPPGVFGVLSNALGGFRNNPLIAAVYSITSLFTSQDISGIEKRQIHDEMICVLSFSAETYADSRAIEADMARLKQNVAVLQSEAEAYFDDHLAIVGFTGGYPEFLRDKNRIPRRYRQMLASTFQQLRADSINPVVTQLGMNSDRMAGVEYSLLQIREFVARYEGLLRETTALLERMKEYGNKYRSTVCPALGTDLSAKLTSYSSEVAAAQEAFDRAYTRRVIPAEQKRHLFGF
jgi:hypothetical protein